MCRAADVLRCRKALGNASIDKHEEYRSGQTSPVVKPRRRTIKKTFTLSLLFAGLLSVGAQDFIRPITNPVWHGPVGIERSVHPIFMHQALSGTLNTELGQVPVGGDFQVYALQFEIPLSETLSLVAVKDGYVDFGPDATLASSDGFADLAAGLKLVLHQDDAKIVSTRLVVELPIGDDEVWQGNGDGLIAPAISAATRLDKVQVGGTVGLQVGLNSEESDQFYSAWHVSYALTERISPVIELNHFHTFNAGDGGARFTNHVEGGVPSVARFEGGDLVNFGASNADSGDQVTLGLGGRVSITDDVAFGAAYEMPLTDEEDGLMDYRVTADLHILF